MARPPVLDRISRVAPLGIRFWDTAANAVVSEGLLVEVCLSDAPHTCAPARANRIGTFVLPRLPGPRDVEAEFGTGDDAYWDRTPRRAYTVRVSHRDGHYVPFVTSIDLPARGLARPAEIPAESPPLDVVPLFPAAAAPVRAGMAVIRAELESWLPSSAGGPRSIPASWAVLEAHVAGLRPGRGIADREGRVAIVMPYPDVSPASPRPASPPFSPGRPLAQQTWRVRLEAFYTPQMPAPEVADLGRTLQQPPAFLWDDAAATFPLPDQDLVYGQELIVRRTGVDGRRSSSILVTPAVSPL